MFKQHNVLYSLVVLAVVMQLVKKQRDIIISVNYFYEIKEEDNSDEVEG